MVPPPMIQVDQVSRRFGALEAVRDLSFEVSKGEVVGLLGLNGAGKSTTMRMLTGYLPTSAGTIRVGGHDVVTESLAVRRQVGYLAEGVPLYREHRVAEMLRFQGRLFGLPRRRIAERTAEVLERVGLADRARSLIGNLSKGMRQRVGIAVALLPEPEVLILDEPTSGLDPLQRIGVRELVGELAEEHTVIVSSHILPEIEAVCGRLILLHRGTKVADGTKAELLAAEGGSGLELVVTRHRLAEDALREQLAAAVPEAELEVCAEGEHLRAWLRCPGDPSGRVGRLAAERGWVVTRLAWREASLEHLFGRMASGRLEEEAGEEVSA